MNSLKAFRCAVRIADVFDEDRVFLGETPYDIIHEMDADWAVRNSLPEIARLGFVFLPSGNRKNFRVNFQAVDEHGFRCPAFLDETKMDAWLLSLGISLEAISSPAVTP